MNERMKAVIEHPLHKYLGISDVESDGGNGSLTFIATEKFINPAGVLHGGVIYLLCDVCAYAGILSILAPEKEAFTHDIHISVIKAAKTGDVVKIKSRLIKMSKNLCFIDVAAMVSEKVIATARVTKSIVSTKR
jgi:uncharacterized protein (TIGR00369 family)